MVARWHSTTFTSVNPVTDLSDSGYSEILTRMSVHLLLYLKQVKFTFKLGTFPSAWTDSWGFVLHIRRAIAS